MNKALRGPSAELYGVLLYIGYEQQSVHQQFCLLALQGEAALG